MGTNKLITRELAHELLRLLKEYKLIRKTLKFEEFYNTYQLAYRLCYGETC